MIKKSRNILLVLIMAVSFVAICGLSVFADEYTTINITEDTTISNFGDVKDGIVLNLNGHTLRVEGQATCNIAYLEINGGGGTIDFCNTNNTAPIFRFDDYQGGYKYFCIKVNNVTFRNIKAPNLFDVRKVNYNTGHIWDIYDANFVDGSFTSDGGVFYINTNSHARMNFNNCNFVNISSDGDGAALYIENFSGDMGKHIVALDKSSFVNCKSKGAGGAICCTKEGTTIGSTVSYIWDKPVFYNCHAYNGGGAIRGYGDNITVQNAIFAENSTDASYYGGGAIMLDDDYCKVNNCTFFYNHANQGYGGALYMNDSDDEIHDCLFSNNNSYPGCGKDIYYPPKTVSGCEFYGYSSSESFYDGYDVSDTSNKLETSWVVPLSDVNYDSSGKLKNGSEANPIILKNAEELAALAADIAADGETYNNKFYKLDADIPNAFLRIALFDGELNFAGHTIRTKLTETYFDKGSPILRMPKVINVLGESESYADTVDYIDCSNGSASSKKILVDQRISDDRDTLDLQNKIYLITGKVNINGRIKVAGNSKLIFAPGAVLNANNGIEVPEGSTLSLYSQDLNNKGKLNATCKDLLGAGIGGNYAAKYKEYRDGDTTFPCHHGTGMGTLYINAVDVTAQGKGGAGIGGGEGAPTKGEDVYVREFPGMGGDGGSLNIYKSVVYAEGHGGKDIGGGNGGRSYYRGGGYSFFCAGAGGGEGTTINLFSGEIKATAAGIGGGNTGADVSNSSTAYYCPAHHSDIVFAGGNGGTLNIISGKVSANTIKGGNGTKRFDQHGSSYITWSGAEEGAATVLNVAEGLYVRTGNNADNLGPAVLATADTLKDVASKFCFIGTHTHKYKTVYKWTEKHTVCTAYKTCESCGYVESSKIAKTIEYRVIESKVEGEIEGEAESLVSTEYTATFEDGEQTTELIEGEPEVPQNEGQTESGEMGNLASIFSSGSIWIVLGIAVLALIGILALVLTKLRKSEN